MGDLTGKRIDQTFDGLIKTNDEEPIDGTLKTLQDGVGNNLPMQVSTTGVNFTGTVTGIPTGGETYTLSVDENVPDAIITLTDSQSVVQEITLQSGNNINMVVDIPNKIIDIEAANTTYDYTVAGIAGTGNVKLTLTGSDGTTDDVILIAGNNTTLSNNAAGQLTISAANTTYDLGAAGAAGNINFALSGSDTSNDVVTMQAGTNITLTDNGSNTFTIDAAGGGGGTTAVYKPERRFSTASSDNTWNFAMPQNGNNYSAGGFQVLIDVSVDRRYFTEIWADSISRAAVLIDANQFDGSLVCEIFDAHPETGMPRDVIATSQPSFTTGTGVYRWVQMNFPVSIPLGYGHYYASIKADSGTVFNGIYAAVQAGANISRLVQFDVDGAPQNPNEAVDYVGGIYDGNNQTGNYPLNYAFSQRIDMFPNIMMKE